DRVEPAEVVVERGLARLGLGDADRLDGALVLEAGDPGEVRAEPVAEPGGQCRRRRGRQLAERLDPLLREPLDGLWSDSWDQPGGGAREPLACTRASQLH